MANFELTVGNVGTVYTGRNKREASRLFRHYQELSESGSGRAGNETVTLFADNEIIREYIPQPQHYIAMAGLHGCMPNYQAVLDSYNDAVDTLSGLHELGRRRRQELKRDGYLELNLHRDGYEYCEIVACDCDDPDSHSDY